jgi:Xaa-Pro aminopeptidase
MRKQDLDLSIISDPKNVYYFTGIPTMPVLSLVYSACLPTFLLVFRDDKTALLVSQRDAKIAGDNFDGDVVTYVNYDLRQHIIAYPDFVAKQLKKLLSKRGSRIYRVGVESWNISHTSLRALRQSSPVEFYDLSKSILRMRATKDPDELIAIRESCDLSDFAYSIAKSASIQGRSEIEVYGIVQQVLIKKVGSYQFFAGDFVSGERSLAMGGPPTSRCLNNGETFILDLWLTTRGYWSDTCRTFVVGGRPTATQMQVLELLKRAMAAGEEKLRPETSGREVYKAVFDVIATAGLGDRFPHHAGHGIGLDDQEPPFFIPASDEVLTDGMVCTLEPGVYIPEVGGLRIEHDYLITQGRAERLTSYPVDL